MGFFNDDPFEDIVREFFGSSPVKKTRREQFIRGENEDREIDFIEDEKNIYLVFEIPGYNEKDVSVTIDGKELKISAKKTNSEEIQDYLHQKLKQGILIQKRLPNIANSKNMKYKLNNGILEITFNKK